jgi:hypothetical protein
MVASFILLVSQSSCNLDKNHHRARWIRLPYLFLVKNTAVARSCASTADGHG